MPNRKCIDFKDYCSQSGKSYLCTREQMYFHIEKIPITRMVKIVSMYKLTKIPSVLNRRTLANLITDYTIENVADELMKCEKS